MLPGPTIIKKCSACTGLIKKHTIASGNTFGAIFWTDGKMDAPMLPDSPKLVKCPHCGSLIWIDELETVEEISAFDPGNTNAREPGKPNLGDYASFLSNNRLLQPDVEKDLRIRAWWRGNDERRRDQHSSFTETEIQNLDALTALLDRSINYERLMQAEIKRERGDFEPALELLDQPFDAQLSDAVTFIRNLAQQGDSVVTPIQADMD